ncbi:MAG: nuclear transport factor 2 family protein [Polyangiaceae bacterium]|nr:nuclear transport factor 2 family protein [Polyangiaceae bacterium]
MIRPSIKALAPLLLVASAALGGCTTHYIPNTDVEDSEENRKIISFCEKYRHAVENKDVGALLQLASPQYYEDGGNVDAADDLDYAGLRDYLTSKFQDARAIRYEIRYRRVLKEEEVVYVDYTFSASYRIPGQKGEEWRRKVDDNRLELVPHQDSFRIVAGM